MALPRKLKYVDIYISTREMEILKSGKAVSKRVNGGAYCLKWTNNASVRRLVACYEGKIKKLQSKLG